MEPLLVKEGPVQGWQSLTARDHATLDALMRNEADMAYRRRARWLLDALVLRDGDRVLDGGCGMGFYLLAMSRLRRLRLTGLDTDAARLQQARRAGVPATLVQGRLEHLPFPDAAFDRVLLTEVLEHVPDEQTALEEIHRVLRPGGRLAISVPHAGYPFWWDPINRCWTALGGKPIRSGPLVGIWTGHQRLYEPADLERVVAAAGFHIQAVEETTHFSFPFQHFLVYGVGKPLLERGLLPSSVRNAADRLSAGAHADGAYNPLPLVLAAFRYFDRFNERQASSSKRTFVNVLLLARKLE